MSMSSFDRHGDSSNECVAEKAKLKLQRPAMYKVVMLNDDYTPMDFVIEVLARFFGCDQAKAVSIMRVVHTQGRAVCGIYSRDVAQTKTAQVINYARQQQYPLLCRVEQT
jgi:ATP-dependent Clp protease adaptor protein ClpS